MAWEVVRTDKLDSELVVALLEDEVGGVVLPGFLDERSRSAAIDGIERTGMDYYANVDPPIGRIGITQYEHRDGEDAKRRYFVDAERANRVREQIFADSGDLLGLVIDALAQAWPGEVGIAREHDGREYFAGLVRVIREGLLHCDWAPHDAPGWAIGEVDAQITWNIYCQLPDKGGATIVHHRAWQPEAEQWVVPGSYGYHDDLVAGVEQVRIDPAAGDLVFFNSRNFHRIEPSAGSERISVSSFVGRSATGDLVLWS